ncbi:MAG: cupredoxin domain-containing protein [Candidatus Binataceae bacterium]
MSDPALNGGSQLIAPTGCALLSWRSLLYYMVLPLVAAILVVCLDRRLAKASPAPVLVVMRDVPPSFQPKSVTITVGETVEWKNVGNSMHHATSDSSLAIKGTDVANPRGAQPFDSGFMRPGETFSHKFMMPGIYRYVCVAHEASGMSGTVIVK